MIFLSKKWQILTKIDILNQSINSFIQLIHSFNLFIGYCLIDFFNQKMTYFDKNWRFQSINLFIHSFIHWLIVWLIDYSLFWQKINFHHWLIDFLYKEMTKNCLFWLKIYFYIQSLIDWLIDSSFIHWELIDWLKIDPFYTIDWKVICWPIFIH